MPDLRTLIRKAGETQASLARHLGIGRSTVCNICDGLWPKRSGAELRREVEFWLQDHGLAARLDEPAAGSGKDDPDEEPELRSNEMLNVEARKRWGLVKDPFVDDVQNEADVFLTDSSRYVAEYMYQTAKSASMLAVIGESGSGKTTLRKLLLDRIAAHGEKIKVVFPRTLDRTRLTASSICDAIIGDLTDRPPRRSFEAKCRQVEQALTESSRAGWSHVLMIEEAHDLSVKTLKYLKRFWELEDGFRRLLGIILIAQPELRFKLDESRNWEARELIRRMEVVELDPFIDADEVKAYLALKFARIGASVDQIFDAGAYAAIVEKMTKRAKSGRCLRYCYPLAVNVVAKAAMNAAAEIYEPKVSAEMIRSI